MTSYRSNSTTQCHDVRFEQYKCPISFSYFIMILFSSSDSTTTSKLHVFKKWRRRLNIKATPLESCCRICYCHVPEMDGSCNRTGQELLKEDVLQPPQDQEHMFLEYLNMTGMCLMGLHSPSW